MSITTTTTSIDCWLWRQTKAQLIRIFLANIGNIELFAEPEWLKALTLEQRDAWLDDPILQKTVRWSYRELFGEPDRDNESVEELHLRNTRFTALVYLFVEYHRTLRELNESLKAQNLELARNRNDIMDVRMDI